MSVAQHGHHGLVTLNDIGHRLQFRLFQRIVVRVERKRRTQAAHRQRTELALQKRNNQKIRLNLNKSINLTSSHVALHFNFKISLYGNFSVTFDTTQCLPVKVHRHPEVKLLILQGDRFVTSHTREIHEQMPTLAAPRINPANSKR